MEYSSYLLDLAWSFPQHAPAIYSVFSRTHAFVSSLSPDVRSRIQRTASTAVSLASSATRKGRSIYSAIMEFPKTPDEKWVQPSRVILSPLARIVLLWMPVVQEWEGTTTDLGEKGALYVLEEGHVYGLGAPALHAVLYLKMGKLVRFSVDPVHFRIPAWKHLLQYFGAVPGDAKVPLLLSAGYHVVTYSAPGLPFAAWALETGVPVVPAAALGINDMLPVRALIPVRLVHTTASRISAVVPRFLNPLPASLTSNAIRDAAVPVVLPSSWERQYIRFSTPIRTQGPALKLLAMEEAVSGHQAHRSAPLQLQDLVARRTRRSIALNAAYLEELRSEDPKRYVLSPLYRVTGVVRGGGTLIRRASARGLRAAAMLVEPQATPEKQELAAEGFVPAVTPTPPPEYFPVTITSFTIDDDVLSGEEWFDCE
ncbi:hypothetical protein BDZ88DRAFT_96954 [Geranomyces variabilis]|nr:hypothetical protein BDZ88DRAFT_96954 [Geranomyces variabilis]KAJ3141681.1 hypothetical protein HDU90_006024 [Geranomyces variabilis]